MVFDSFGFYVYCVVIWFEDVYIILWLLFGDKDVIFVYCIEIVWELKVLVLVFWEGD